MSKRILGLDLGTNSIGWALVEQNFEQKEGRILGMGSRIIPMDAAILGEFDKGNSVSQTAERTGYRGVRRLRERQLLRRERLHRVLNVLNFLPEHYASAIDFTKRFGKFKPVTEPKITYHKGAFIFKSSYQEMLEDFNICQPQLVENGKLIPYDWTIYFLRKKALTKVITKEEMAWLILNFNQKRGYYQLRGEEEEENPNKLIEFHSLKITDVVGDETPNKKGETWYSLHLENGWIYRRSSKTPLFEWKDKVRDFIVTTDLNDDGTVKLDKDGEEKRSFRAPKEDDWTLLKKKTEQEIDQSTKTVGTYIYDTLLQNPNQKIKGKLVRTIERKFYKEELIAILQKQIELQPNLFSEEKLNDCIRELYKQNEAHQNMLNGKDFVHLLVNDIIFYQRPLRSQKSSIGECSLEYRFHNKIQKDTDGSFIKDSKGKYVFELDKSGNIVKDKQYLKAIPKSHPLYQEFRLWQWIYNLKIHTKEDDTDVTNQFITRKEDLEYLFEQLNNRKEIKQDALIKILFEKSGLKGKALSAEAAKYRWNYVEDKVYPCNETRTQIRTRLDKVENVPTNFLTPEKEQQLWHIIYSVTDKIEYERALETFTSKNNLDKTSFVENFRKFPPFKSEYGAFSEKAVKKLLPLMRIGNYWSWESIDAKIQDRIDKILTGEYDEQIKTRVREKAIHLTNKEDFQGLQLWLAQYIVYDRHSEASDIQKWNSVSDLEKYLKDFKQHSLRNPIVEQVITETLRVVKDIWSQFGGGKENFFDEIHVELGREMKLTADERDRMTRSVTDNENTNLRIKNFLVELFNDNSVEGVRPYSPMQQEALKIYEDGILNSGIEIPEDIQKISKSAQPTKVEFQRYKLWLEQKYKSPYTEQIIPLSKLFTSEYEIEHVIPQSRYFDDSFSNKVICEAAVNKEKDRQLGMEFIKNNGGRIIETGFGKSVKILTVEQYEDFVKEHYKNNRSKRNKLLMEEIPEKMIERQLNDTRYISKFISQVLSNIVRSETNDDGVNSKNIIPGNGKITTQLKQDWGLNDVWNEVILPRFKRMNELTQTSDFTSTNTSGKTIPTVPLELSKGFQKKRIDHRHHAMDALVIACATRDHVNLLNNQSAKSENSRYDLQTKLRKKEKWQNNGKEGEKFTTFFMPWATFVTDTKKQLEETVISFKQNLRVINKTSNKSERYVDKNGELKKVLVSQTKGDSWAIRKPMHKETVSGKVDLPRIKVPKGKILTATRKAVDTSFTPKVIESITDTGIQKILLSYLNGKDNDPELAFSPEGMEDLNKNIEQYNDGKKHQPIYKVRIFELGSKFQVGQSGNKKDKYVEAAKGTNLFFAIYQDENGKRSYDTIPLNEVIERQKQGLNSVPETNEKGHKLLFHLSPNDLVYVPEQGEVFDVNNLKKDRIYKVVSFTGGRLSVIQNCVSTTIVNKMEFTQLNKIELTKEKEVCIKLKVDRLGNISKA
ncbi:type II CRISPR RNA-guided endonuclease Cas9 [Flavobacterium sp.]|uniref:type II CRISPR RNA-guided endonuclease Cas9 n=1 Tax=Flavobacterium sp. TaxID=239 RepID=UPI0039E21DBE